MPLSRGSCRSRWEILLRVEITGGEPLKDALQVNDIRAAIEVLYEALCPSSRDVDQVIKNISAPTFD